MITKLRARPGPKPGMVKPVRPTQHQGGRGPRPLTWITGPDPVRHQRYVAFQRARCQAVWRQEGWELTFDQYEAIWGDQWHRRGRTVDTLCLSRRDYDLPWSPDNVEVITRREHNQRQAAWRLSRL